MSSLLSEIELDGSPDQAELLLSTLKNTITSISARRDALADQLKNYKALHIQLEENEKQLESVTVYLGEGYFVERTPQQALVFMSSRVVTLEKAVSELDAKAKEAEDTIFKLSKFNELAKLESNSKEEKVNEEGLLFMDIKEELDEEGHVISATINDKPLEHPLEKADTIESPASILKFPQKKEFEYIQESLIEENGTFSNDSDPIKEDQDQLQELFEDMEIVQRPLKSINDAIVNRDDLLNKIDELKISPDDKFKLKQMCLEEYAKLYDTKGKVDQDKERSNVQDSTGADISEESLDEVKSKERQEVIASIVKENNLDVVVSTSTPVNEKSVAIDRNDILELELLADDFDDSEASVVKYADDEEWDFDFSDGEEIDDDDDDDDDDDLADELLYGDRSAILTPNQNVTASNMLWDQVMKLRETGTEDVNGNPPIETARTEKNNKSKKTVRFAENLQIKEVENISESLRNVPHRHRVSLYRQNLIATNRANSTHDEIEYVEDFPSISDSFVEDNQQDNSKAENNIVENYIIENNIVEDNMVENNIVENNVVEKNIVDSIPQTIQENTIEQNQLDSKGVSKFKKGILQSLPRKLIVNEALPNAASGETWNRREMIEKSIVEVEEKKISPLVKDETDGVHREVVERQPTTTASTASDKEKVERKVSKFRANRTKLKSSAAKNDLFEEDRSIQRSDLDEANISIEEDEVIDEEVRSHSSIKETTLDYLSLQDDMDTMAKAYVLGIYDDDIRTVGPVVDKLDDFEVLNRMIDSMSSKESLSNQEETNRKSEILKSLKDYDTSFDPQLDEIVPELVPEDEEADEGPILLDEIVENDFNATGEIEDFDEMENEMLNQEVVTNYHKLRQRIIFQNNDKGFRKTDEELAMEPLDEDGNPIKVSRFKAARMTN